MKALDLFCCQGGASMGLSNAGFDVVGVDIDPQPKYPFEFHQANAMEFDLGGFDFIWASPPCQGYSHLTPEDHKGKYQKLIPALREKLKLSGSAYAIENVRGAMRELENPNMLCGSMFGLRTQRHRYFETSFPLKAPRKCDHSLLPLLVTTASKASRKKRLALGMRPKTVKNAAAAYGIDWMDFNGLKECIPPAYAEYIANEYLRGLQNDR